MKYPKRVKDLSHALYFYTELIKMHQKASLYINDFAWCREVKDSTLYLNQRSTLCAFLLEIDNAASNADNFYG
jgi:hypothetical protein